MIILTAFISSIMFFIIWSKASLPEPLTCVIACRTGLWVSDLFSDFSVPPLQSLQWATDTTDTATIKSFFFHVFFGLLNVVIYLFHILISIIGTQAAIQSASFHTLPAMIYSNLMCMFSTFCCTFSQISMRTLLIEHVPNLLTKNRLLGLTDICNPCPVDHILPIESYVLFRPEEETLLQAITHSH